MEAAKPRRNTRQRQVILEELRKSPSHPTAAELYEAVRRREPRISLATVYRNLEILAAAGQAHRLGAAGEKARFEPDLEPHCHVWCSKCGRLDDVGVPPGAFLRRSVKSLAGYKIMRYELEFSGLCPTCQKEIEQC